METSQPHDNVSRKLNSVVNSMPMSSLHTNISIAQSPDINQIILQLIEYEKTIHKKHDGILKSTEERITEYMVHHKSHMDKISGEITKIINENEIVEEKICSENLKLEKLKSKNLDHTNENQINSNETTKNMQVRVSDLTMNIESLNKEKERLTNFQTNQNEKL